MKRSFYLSMMTIITVLILYGFSHTVEADILNPAVPPPKILYIHVAVFLGWLVMVLTQTALIWTRNLRLHRKLGWFGAGFGLLMVIVGLATTLVMGHQHVLRDGPIGGMFVYRPFEDIILFGAFFGLAIYWRKRPDFHRRLMLLAAIIVTPPAISRIPGVHPLSMVYVATDLLIGVAVLNDLFTVKRIHTVYRWAAPIIVIAQLALLAAVSLHPAALVELGLAMTR
jgi:hypothetical protein